MTWSIWVSNLARLRCFKMQEFCSACYTLDIHSMRLIMVEVTAKGQRQKETFQGVTNVLVSNCFCLRSPQVILCVWRFSQLFGFFLVGATVVICLALFSVAVIFVLFALTKEQTTKHTFLQIRSGAARLRELIN